jgi:quinoprotein relay system zinc metallohydrolase 2
MWMAASWPAAIERGGAMTTSPLQKPMKQGRHITRGAFLTGSAAIALAPIWQSRTAMAAAEFGLTQIASGVFVHQGVHAQQSEVNQGDIANASFVIGGDAVAVIDTSGSAKMGRNLLAGIRAITDKPIRYVINTHMHPDHVFGNKPFQSEATTFVAHHKMGRALAARAQNYLGGHRQMIGEAAFAGTDIVTPSLPVANRMELDLGGRILVCEAQPTAHTDNDLTVTDITTGTLFLGDLLFSGHIPTIDGSIRGWLSVLQRLSSTAAPARVVPGHGPPSMAWPDAAAPITGYLETLATEVRALIKNGTTLREAGERAGRSEATKWQLFDAYHARNVAATFAELEWE